MRCKCSCERTLNLTILRACKEYCEVKVPDNMYWTNGKLRNH
jgi:hypothetical protein